MTVFIRGINPVREKSADIPVSHINPGSMSGGVYFPEGIGERAVYLDPKYDYPEQPNFLRADTLEEIVARGRNLQKVALEQVMADDSRFFIDRDIDTEVGPGQVGELRQSVRTELGTMFSAEFYERVYSQLLGEALNVVLISTGLTPHDGENYHEIHYLAS